LGFKATFSSISAISWRPVFSGGGSRSQKFVIVAKLCFFNLLYYREMRYPISNKGNPSFINLVIQRRFTENA